MTRCHCCGSWVSPSDKTCAFCLQPLSSNSGGRGDEVAVGRELTPWERAYALAMSGDFAGANALLYGEQDRASVEELLSAMGIKS